MPSYRKGQKDVEELAEQKYKHLEAYLVMAANDVRSLSEAGWTTFSKPERVKFGYLTRFKMNIKGLERLGDFIIQVNSPTDIQCWLQNDGYIDLDKEMKITSDVNEIKKALVDIQAGQITQGFQMLKIFMYEILTKADNFVEGIFFEDIGQGSVVELRDGIAVLLSMPGEQDDQPNTWLIKEHEDGNWVALIISPNYRSVSSFKIVKDENGKYVIERAWNLGSSTAQNLGQIIQWMNITGPPIR